MFIKKTNIKRKNKLILWLGLALSSSLTLSYFAISLSSCNTKQIDPNKIINIADADLEISNPITYIQKNSLSLLSVFKRKQNINEYFQEYNNILEEEIIDNITKLSNMNTDEIPTTTTLGTT